MELILDKQRIKHMEPALTDDVVGVLHAPTAGLASPYELTFALAENAAMNGVKFFRNSEVVKIKHTDYTFTVRTFGDQFKCTNLINAAGGQADHQIIQRLGRGLRIASDKKHLMYYDFIFELNEYLEKHSHKRIKVLKKEGHVVNTHPIEAIDEM